MVFYLVGLGLGGPDDVTVKGLKVIQSASRVYLEAYTSILTCGKDALVSLWIDVSWSMYFILLLGTDVSELTIGITQVDWRISCNVQNS